MTFRLSFSISVPVLRELLDYHAVSHSALDPSAMAEQAIREWLARQECPDGTPAGPGYYWKALFLPQGSKLRITTRDTTYVAEVIGEQIVLDGLSYSPNALAQACAGAVRNAWETIYVQMPGERQWRQAAALRSEIQRGRRRKELGQAAPSPRPQRPPQPGTWNGVDHRANYRRREDLLLD